MPNTFGPTLCTTPTFIYTVLLRLIMFSSMTNMFFPNPSSAHGCDGGAHCNGIDCVDNNGGVATSFSRQRIHGDRIVKNALLLRSQPSRIVTGAKFWMFSLGTEARSIIR
eukprot:TRINITY_DN23815_c0_g1_i1.p1 TRINITY_DN23815_c0_g1~~TRINITY_DN23815_c0_g1_i1.p1  ORF type:complete len:110 (-),score=2.73 TRINITY_DN23815_c0_g1_i1:161-490(-)